MWFESNVFTPRTYELEWPIPSFDAFRAECLKKLGHVANSVCTISYPNAEGRTETITTDSDVRTLAHLVGHAAKANRPPPVVRLDFPQVVGDATPKKAVSVKQPVLNFGNVVRDTLRLTVQPPVCSGGKQKPPTDSFLVPQLRL